MDKDEKKSGDYMYGDWFLSGMMDAYINDNTSHGGGVGPKRKKRICKTKKQCEKLLNQKYT